MTLTTSSTSHAPTPHTLYQEPHSLSNITGDAREIDPDPNLNPDTQPEHLNQLEQRDLQSSSDLTSGPSASMAAVGRRPFGMASHGYAVPQHSQLNSHTSHNYTHAHGHGPRRERSYSRSSSSPSPPPLSPRQRTSSLPTKQRTSSRSGRRPLVQKPRQDLHYAGSASSAAWVGSDNEGGDRFVSVNNDDTEVEASRFLHRTRNLVSLPEGREASPRQQPTSLPRSSIPRIPADVAAHPLAARVTLLPYKVRLGPIAFNLTRKRAEDAILLGALVAGIVKLTYTWNEVALAGGTSERQ